MDSSAALEKAWEKGVNFYDTANIYAFGESETLFGQVQQNLCPLQGRRAPHWKCADAFGQPECPRYVERAFGRQPANLDPQRGLNVV